ncbi:acyl-CoA dehydrogenase [Halobellus salinisoli]|uniref:acyl-CoA dehydrogenase n=1 Tax=Halobellus salinisoli TaxID=3108500 RepID=UPI003008A423
MSNFKSGSGNLNFGGDDEKDEKSKSATESTKTQDERNTAKSTESGTARAASAENQPTETTSSSKESKPGGQTQTATTAPTSEAEKYPYFVRRNNVGDERDTRLEIHVRDKVAEQEGKFRSELAEHLGTNEISKTDAREFALLAAFHNPKQVADLMRDEGFGTLG